MTELETGRFSLRSLFRVMTFVAVFVALLASLATFLDRRDAARQSELARLEKLDRATVAEIIKEVEAIRVHLGRAPKDQAELEKLLENPMPFVHDGTFPKPINYRRSGDNSFQLQYELWATDDWIYDSEKPNAGWVQHWY